MFHTHIHRQRPFCQLTLPFDLKMKDSNFCVGFLEGYPTSPVVLVRGSGVEAKKDRAEARKDRAEARKDVDEAKKDVDEAKKDVDEAKKDGDEAKKDGDEAKKDGNEQSNEVH